MDHQSAVGDTIADRLRACRDAVGISRAEAARRLGITFQSVRDLENGNSRAPSAKTLLDMRDKLGYDPDYVMRGTGRPLLRATKLKPSAS